MRQVLRLFVYGFTVSLGVLFVYALVEIERDEEARNPFQVGQKVSVTDKYAEVQGAEEAELLDCQIINMTAAQVRIRCNGLEKDLHWSWLKADGELELTDEWVFSNPFRVGQEVCAVPDSIREDFLDIGVVVDLQNELIKLDDYPDWINWTHFQYCP